MKVKATDKFKALNVFPAELGFIPEEGTEFEVTEERFNALAKNNSFGVSFVEAIKEESKVEKVEIAKEEPKEVEKTVTKKTTGKKSTKKGK